METASYGRMVVGELLRDYVEESAPVKVRDPLEDRAFASLGRNAVFHAKPQELHFAGFAPGATHRCKLVVTNVSDFGQRLHILPPKSGAFRVLCASKKGRVAPGMAEELTVEFCPTELRYYTDALRIHTAGSTGIVVPIHAYPAPDRDAMSHAMIPARHDFGAVALGTTRRATLHVRNPSEVSFLFKADIAENTDADEFSVSPAVGELAPHGSAEIAVAFTPTHAATRHAKLRLVSSDFASTAAPSVCELVGNGAFGKHFERAARDAEPLDGLEGLDPLDLRTLDGTAAIASLKRLNLGGGAGRGDGATRGLHRQRVAALRETGEYGVLPTHVGPPPASGGRVDEVPWKELTRMGAPGSFAGEFAGPSLSRPVRQYILSGNHGYVRKGLMHGVKRGTANGDSADEGPNAAAAAAARRAEKEADFLAEFEKMAEMEKVKEMRFCHAPGAPVISEEGAAAVVEGRKERAAERSDAERRIARDRLTTANGASNGVVCTTSQEEKAAALSEYTPRFDLNSNDDWTKRFMTIERFVRAVHTVMYRQRANKRLKYIRAMLSSIGGKSKDKVAAFVAHEMLSSGQNGKSKDLEMPFRLDEICVVVHPPPQAPDVNFVSYNAHAVPAWTPLSRYGTLSAERQPKDLTEGFVREPMAPLDDYLLPFPDATLRTGAGEEVSAVAGMSGSGLNVPCKETTLPAPPRVADPAPAALLREAVEPLRHNHGPGAALSSTAACGVLGGCRPIHWGIDEGHRIVPKGFAFHDSVAYETASMGSFEAMRREPSLSGRWVERRDPWEITPFGPAPFMTGPDPAHLYEVAEHERLKDAAYYDGKLGELRSSLGIEAAPAPAAEAEEPAAAAAGDAAEEGEGEVPVTAQEESDPALLLPRMRHMRTLEADKRAARDALEARRISLMTSMSAKVADPRLRL